MSALVLLVEDNPDDVFFFKRAVKLAGINHPIHVVTDGQAAIDYLQGAGRFHDRTLHPLPSLIVLDLQLPHLSGFAVLEWIRKSELGTTIVTILSSCHVASEVNRAYQLGANSFIVKPASADRLVEIVRELFAYWLGVNALPPYVPRGPHAGR